MANVKLVLDEEGDVENSGNSDNIDLKEDGLSLAGGKIILDSVEAKRIEVGKGQFTVPRRGYCIPSVREAVRESLEEGVLQLYCYPECRLFKELPLYLIDFRHIGRSDGTGSLSFSKEEWEGAATYMSVKGALCGISRMEEWGKIREQCERITGLAVPESGTAF